MPVRRIDHSYRDRPRKSTILNLADYAGQVLGVELLDFLHGTNEDKKGDPPVIGVKIRLFGPEGVLAEGNYKSLRMKDQFIGVGDKIVGSLTQYGKGFVWEQVYDPELHTAANAKKEREARAAQIEAVMA